MCQTKKRPILFFTVFTLTCYYLPLGLILLEIIPFSYRFHMLVAMAVVLSLYAGMAGHSLFDLGIRSDTLRGSLIWNLAVSAILATLMYSSHAMGMIREPTPPSWSWFYIFYIFVSSPAQEFLYRGLFFAEMRKCKIERAIQQILLSAVNYCLLHVVYKDLLTLYATFMMGAVWGWIYYRYPNIFGVTLSHAVLGLISINVGLI